MITTTINGYFGGFYEKETDVPNNKQICEIEYLNNFINPFFNGTEWLEGANAQEIENFEKNKIKEYSEKIWQKTRALNLSAKKRVLDKINENLTFEDLNELEKKYKIKGEVALGILTGAVTSGVAYELIGWEQINDFPAPKLDATIEYINANYNANIELTDNNLHNYCKLILFKIQMGEYMDLLFENLIENFRSKLLTNLREKEFIKIDARLELVDTITNDSTLEDIEILKTNFDNI